MEAYSICTASGNFIKVDCIQHYLCCGRSCEEETCSSWLEGPQSVFVSNAVPDPLLSSLILPLAEEFVSCQPQFLAETRPPKESPDEIVSRGIFLLFEGGHFLYGLCLVYRRFIQKFGAFYTVRQRTKKREQKDASLSNGYCWASYLMTIYEGSLPCCCCSRP